MLAMAFVSLPFWMIGALFIFAGFGSLYCVADVVNGHRDMRLGPVAAFFVVCMLFAAGFFYFAAFLLMKGLPL
ncbi:hypothetical protein ONR75_11070 [Rhodopseudomonas sp. P2A-2r]|uniref:hypothetical protein n=1 Tax=Rhodopseudomonas sp. P2A-2r TaxID=2991972 RepID=UPI002233EA5E|nr:hypothetical protein [Rhodopseudomonas sp. P2A-2r]UZE51100.1 hypothetical protein ONR75_11070 [Rhodopseudomonas sp. P2A-2r]